METRVGDSRTWTGGPQQGRLRPSQPSICNLVQRSIKGHFDSIRHSVVEHATPRQFESMRGRTCTLWGLLGAPANVHAPYDTVPTSARVNAHHKV